MLVTSKGQITIPKKLRDALGFLPRTDVEFERVGVELRIRKTKKTARGNKLIEAMAGKGSVSMTTDEILKLIRE